LGGNQVQPPAARRPGTAALAEDLAGDACHLGGEGGTQLTEQNGYVKLHRALLEHPIFTQLSLATLKIWIYCLARAN
jgi:hypothetical protein